ncbi:hypothetical protein LALCM10_180003 [Dellaglioa algida]|nr:hypothetical protein LALCM10_180003 [Dellaglioa algida]
MTRVELIWYVSKQNKMRKLVLRCQIGKQSSLKKDSLLMTYY